MNRKKTPPAGVKVGTFWFPAYQAQFNPSYNGECFHCQGTDRALEPVSLYCGNCADKILTRYCGRCGNFINREDIDCSCNKLTVEATYLGDGFRNRPLFKDNDGQVYSIDVDPYSYQSLEIRLANAGLRPVHLARSEGAVLGVIVTNVLLKKP